MSTRGVALLAIGALLLTGCSTGGSENTMTPQEAQAELLALLDETQEAVGGQWQVDDDDTPLQCILPSGETGVTFSGYRRASQPVEGGADAVAAFWESKGFTVEPRPELAGLDDVFVRFPGEPDRYLHFAIGDNVMALEGWGRCVPGNALDEIERIQRESAD